VSSALLEVPTGILSDMVGRRRTVIYGAFTSLVSVICYAIGGGYWVLLLGAIAEGAQRALFSGNNDALLHDTLSELNEQGDYHVQLGRVSSAYQVALAISAIAGSALAAWSFAAVMWLSVVPKLVMVALSFRFVEPQHHHAVADNPFAHLREALAQFARNPRLRWLTLANVIGFGAGEADFQLRTVFIESLWPLWAIGVARSIANVSAAASFYFAGSWIKRFGERRLLFGGMAISDLMNAAALVWASVFSPVIMGSTSIFFGVNTVSVNTIMQRHFTDAQRSTMGSLTAFGGSICFAVLSVSLGWLADEVGVRNALLVITAIAATRLVFFALGLRRAAPLIAATPQGAD
jgi:MFS family permease